MVVKEPTHARDLSVDGDLLTVNKHLSLIRNSHNVLTGHPVQERRHNVDVKTQRYDSITEYREHIANKSLKF